VLNVELAGGSTQSAVGSNLQRCNIQPANPQFSALFAFFAVKFSFVFRLPSVFSRRPGILPENDL
jgi:hypothetical protein